MGRRRRGASPLVAQHSLWAGQPAPRSSNLGGRRADLPPLRGGRRKRHRDRGNMAGRRAPSVALPPRPSRRAGSNGVRRPLAKCPPPPRAWFWPAVAAGATDPKAQQTARTKTVGPQFSEYAAFAASTSSTILLIGFA